MDICDSFEGSTKPSDKWTNKAKLYANVYKI